MSPSRRDGLISWSWCGFICISRPAKLNHIRRGGDGTLSSNLSQAINCQANIDQSLRDENTACAPLGTKTALTSGHLAIDGTEAEALSKLDAQFGASKNLQRPELLSCSSAEASKASISRDRRLSDRSGCRSRLGPLLEGRFAAPGRYRLTA
jgi:hypothetical protein